MSTDRESGRTARAYARELERSLERLSGRPVVFSRRDWDLARRWHDAGVPLGLVLELLEERGERAARGLHSIASVVETSWQVVRAGQARTRPGAVPAPSTRSPIDDPYAEAATRTGVEALSRLLQAASARLRAGADRPTVDRFVDDGLAAACPAGWLEQAAHGVAERLVPYRGRVPPDELERVRIRTEIDTLRARLGLPPTMQARRPPPIG